ncbi:MAG TPA: hypothetical protein PK043_15055, partial [Alicycliphilus sp.]|nr:hypothetical protein [Alicycliphilus sp.]
EQLKDGGVFLGAHERFSLRLGWVMGVSAACGGVTGVAKNDSNITRKCNRYKFGSSWRRSVVRKRHKLAAVLMVGSGPMAA